MRERHKGPIFLVVDDDLTVRKLLVRMLQSGFPGCSSVELSSPIRVPQIAALMKPQLILMDWAFPGGVTGVSVCQEVKRRPNTRHIPIILISGEHKQLQDRAKGVSRGADVFLSKPVTTEELCAYARALLARTKVLGQPIRIGSFTLSRTERCAWWQGKPLASMTPNQFEMLQLMAGKFPLPTLARDFSRRIWKNKANDKQVAAAAGRLRAKLKAYPGLTIESIPGMGYRLMVDV